MGSKNANFFHDQSMLKISLALLDSPQSARQISNRCDVPIATVYRKLKELEEKKMLHISGIIKNNRNRIKLYKKKF